jgi:hypothetical protein
MTVPSDKMLLVLAAHYGVPVNEGGAALDKEIKLAAAQRRQRRKQAGMWDRDYMTIMELLTKRYSITAAEFASATNMPRKRASGFLLRLEKEGVLTALHRTNRLLHYTLRTP